MRIFLDGKEVKPWALDDNGRAWFSVTLRKVTGWDKFKAWFWGLLNP